MSKEEWDISILKESAIVALVAQLYSVSSNKTSFNVFGSTPVMCHCWLLAKDVNTYLGFKIQNTENHTLAKC